MIINNNNTKQFSLLSYEITKNLNPEIIKDNGIYFTPYDVIKLTIERIKYFEENNNLIINNILEPCCGSCEFVLFLDDYFKNKEIDGIENNKDIYNKIKDISLKNNKFYIEHKNFFFKDNNKKYDLII